jgi:hypothetical protein
MQELEQSITNLQMSNNDFVLDAAAVMMSRKGHSSNELITEFLQQSISKLNLQPPGQEEESREFDGESENVQTPEYAPPPTTPAPPPQATMQQRVLPSVNNIFPNDPAEEMHSPLSHFPRCNSNPFPSVSPKRKSPRKHELSTSESPPQRYDKDKDPSEHSNTSEDNRRQTDLHCKRACLSQLKQVSNRFLVDKEEDKTRFQGALAELRQESERRLDETVDELCNSEEKSELVGTPKSIKKGLKSRFGQVFLQLRAPKLLSKYDTMMEEEDSFEAMEH